MTVVKEFMHSEKEKVDELEVSPKPEGTFTPKDYLSYRVHTIAIAKDSSS